MYRRSTKTNTTTPQWRRLLRSRSLAILLVLGISILTVSLTKEVVRKVQIQRQIQDLENEIATLEQHNQELNTLLAYFNSSSFQEKEAKVKLNLTAPGETVVVLPENESATDDEVTSVAVAASAPVSNLQKWFIYFFN